MGSQCIINDRLGLVQNAAEVIRAVEAFCVDLVDVLGS
jgi:hypothetical protein